MDARGRAYGSLRRSRSTRRLVPQVEVLNISSALLSAPRNNGDPSEHTATTMRACFTFCAHPALEFDQAADEGCQWVLELDEPKARERTAATVFRVSITHRPQGSRPGDRRVPFPLFCTIWSGGHSSFFFLAVFVCGT
jgi:hypothetical protein